MLFLCNGQRLQFVSSLVYMGNLCNSHHGFQEQERSFVWDAQLRENVINKFQFTGCFSKGMVFRFTTGPTNLRRFLGTCTEKGIHIRFSSRDDSTENGVAEHANETGLILPKMASIIISLLFK